MTGPDRSRQIESLLEKLRKQFPRAAERPLPTPLLGLCDGDAVVAEFVRSFMLWEAPAARACAAVEALARDFVDLNELRVSLAEEIAASLGKSYPRAGERCDRLKAALNDIYRREHAVRLAHLADRSKREGRAYLETLARTPHFVAARTALVALQGHAVPVDERLLGRLLEGDLVGDETATPESTSAALERIIRAADSPAACTLLQTWVDEGAKPRKERRARRAPVASPPKRSPARPAGEAGDSAGSHRRPRR